MPANCCLEDIHWRTCLPTTAKHHSTYSEANTFVTSEWKGERGKGLCNAQRKVTPSPPHWGPPFAWPICSFNSLVRPCECDYTVYWSTCFTYFVILESSTRTSLLLYSPFLSLSLSLFFPYFCLLQNVSNICCQPYHGLQICAWNLDIKVL